MIKLKDILNEKTSINEAPKKSTVDMFKALVKFGGPMTKELMEALKLMVKGYGLEYVKREVKKDPKTKNIKKVSFGDTTGLSIKRDDPEKRKSFRARHKCDQAKDKTKARYWSCQMWRSDKSVADMLK